MAKKKFYAVRKGTTIGIFETWEECQAATSGYSNAEFKSFSTREEAEIYLKGEIPSVPLSQNETFEMPPNKVIAYVDGSYDDRLKKYAFGCVILTPSGDTIKDSGNGENPASLMIRNVAGEMLGAMFAVKWAITNGYSEIELRYDYEGIEKWVSGEWRAKNELAQIYAKSMTEWKEKIHMSFLKIAAHSNNKYNDMADELAKAALTEGKGIPPIKRGDYWFTAKGIKREDLLSIIELLREEYSGDISESHKTISHGVSYTFSLGKKDRITISHYDTNRLTVQGKPLALFSCFITYVTELVDVDEIPEIFNQTYKVNVDKGNVQSQFQYHLPNSYDKFNPKMERVLLQAVYNLSLSGDMFDGTFLAQPVMRVLEGHLKKLVLEKHILPDNNYIKYHGFNCFESNGSKYQLKPEFRGSSTPAETEYLGRCYTFYHNNRNVLEHWDDPTTPLDTTKTLDCNQAHDLIKRTLAVIDDFYSI